jgi:hypothetical protein
VNEQFSARVGLAHWGAEDDDMPSDPSTGPAWANTTTVPVVLNYLHGSGKGRLEVGAGVLVGRQQRTHRFSEQSTTSSFLSLTGVLGYRYHPTVRGWMFRAGVTPFVGLGDPDTAYPDRGLTPSAGLSVGYAF